MKDEHTYGKKMARNGRTKVIYKGTFVSIQTLANARTGFYDRPGFDDWPEHPSVQIILVVVHCI